jgi:penicillin-binding protein 1A
VTKPDDPKRPQDPPVPRDPDMDAAATPLTGDEGHLDDALFEAQPATDSVDEADERLPAAKAPGAGDTPFAGAEIAPLPRPSAKAAAAEGPSSEAKSALADKFKVYARKPWFWVASGAAALFIGFGIFVGTLLIGLPSTKDLWAAADNPSITYYDRNGRVIAREGAQNAPPVDIKTLPPYVVQSVMAIEDRKFYQHPGVDFEGLARAVFTNAKSGSVRQGGSTITQQLAKNLFLTNQRSLRRKLQEVVLALWLERQFSKDEIMSLYLSRVFFGANAYGIEAASERYFDKPAKELKLEEAAMLAGLLKAPSSLNPTRGTEGAKKRRDTVLDTMVTSSFITDAERNAAEEKPVLVARKAPNGNLGYFLDYINLQVDTVIGESRDDYNVYTTLDLEAQRAGERIISEVVTAEGPSKNVTQGTLLSIDAEGGVRAMVGGKGYEDSEFNRTTQARRQPGSSFKFFVYLTAMEKGISPNSVRYDVKKTYGDWEPANYDNSYAGAIPLTRAVARSSNMIALQMQEEVGAEAIIETAKKLGVKSKLEDVRSLALGTMEMTLMDLVGGYAPMSNGGKAVAPHGIISIKSANTDKVLYEFKRPTEQVIDPKAMRLTNFLFENVVKAGTAKAAALPGRDVAGKTGTTNDYRDAWFIGYVDGMTTGVWVGNDNNSQMKKVTGGSLPVTIWQRFMLVAARDVPKVKLAMPKGDDFPRPTGPPPGSGPVGDPVIDGVPVEGGPDVVAGGPAPDVGAPTTQPPPTSGPEEPKTAPPPPPPPPVPEEPIWGMERSDTR